MIDTDQIFGYWKIHSYAELMLVILWTQLHKRIKKGFRQSTWPETASFKTSGSLVRVLGMEVCVSRYDCVLCEFRVLCAAYTRLVQLYWPNWATGQFYLLRVSQVCLCGRMLINLTILNLDVCLSAVFQAQCLSFFCLSDVVLPLRLRLGLAAAKVVTLLGYTSYGTFMFFLIFARLKSLVFYLPQLTLWDCSVDGRWCTLKSHYSPSVPARLQCLLCWGSWGVTGLWSFKEIPNSCCKVSLQS